MEYLLKEIIENRKRLMVDLKTEFVNMKSDFKYLSPSNILLGSQYKYYDAKNFLETYRYFIKESLVDLCTSFIFKFHSLLIHKNATQTKIDNLNQDYNFLLQEIDNEISRY